MDESILPLSHFHGNQDDLFFQDISELLNKILDKLEHNLKNTEEFYLTEVIMIQTIEALDIFLQSVNHLIKKCINDKGSTQFVNLPIKELQVHLLSVIKAILNAQKCADHIMLSDLLGHELKDNLTQWKIQILPILKKEILKNS